MEQCVLLWAHGQGVRVDVSKIILDSQVSQAGGEILQTGKMRQILIGRGFPVQRTAITVIVHQQLIYRGQSLLRSATIDETCHRRSPLVLAYRDPMHHACQLAIWHQLSNENIILWYHIHIKYNNILEKN